MVFSKRNVVNTNVRQMSVNEMGLDEAVGLIVGSSHPREQI